MYSIDAESAFFPIHRWIYSADELIAVEYGHTVVSVLPLVRRSIDFDREVEVEEQPCSRPVADQIVKWGEERDSRPPTVRLQLV